MIYRDIAGAFSGMSIGICGNEPNFRIVPAFYPKR